MCLTLWENFNEVFVFIFLCFSTFEYRVGLNVPTIEVRFEHLTVEAKVYIGSRALPTLLNFSINMLQVNLLNHIKKVKIYSKFSNLLTPPGIGNAT